MGNYLKAKTPTTPIKSFQKEDIPIKEMEFNGVTPLLIPGLATADQYFDLNNTLEDNKSKTKGKKKKGKEKLKKRSKHRKSSEKEESDQNDIAELPVLVKLAAEMPEGVNVSDGVDDDDRKTGDEYDPHRALRDINLEDIDENQPKSTNHNGRLINATEEILIENKKKKEKPDEKSKKKKHKKKDSEKRSRPKKKKKS